MICITAQATDLDAPVEIRFARAPYFILIEEGTSGWRAVQNELVHDSGGIGPRAVQLLVQHTVRTLITGQIGANALAALSAAGIAAYAYREGGSVRDALERFREGQLSRLI
jgi:predicted Fe-Mo cluster-binding NifX family protein